MDTKSLQTLIERYEKVQFAVHKKAQILMREEIGEELTTDQHATLGHIKNHGPCTSSKLAEAFFVNKSAITAIINRLTDKGLITRTRNLDDRRVVYLSLTEYGEALYDRCELKVNALVATLITQFESKDIEHFLNTFEKLENILDQQIKQASKDVNNETHT